MGQMTTNMGRVQDVDIFPHFVLSLHLLHADRSFVHFTHVSHGVIDALLICFESVMSTLQHRSSTP